MSVWPAARQYADAGWHVLPLHSAPRGTCTCDKAACSKPGKHPRTANGVDDASTDALQVAAWAQLYPAGNLGIGCRRTGWLVVDLDGAEGISAWRTLLDQHGPAPTLTSRTGRGYHLVYRQPADPLGDSVGKLAPGIDTRGKGYIVAPPSVHASGHVYAWCQPVRDVAHCPPWLADLLGVSRPAVAAEQPRTPTVPTDDRRLHAYLSRAVEGEIQRVLDAGQGGRNNTLNRAAYSLGQLVGAGALDADAVAQALLTAAGAVGLDELEAVPTIRSGLRAGAQHPRSLAS